MRTPLRILRHEPWLALTVVLTLAVGIGAPLALFPFLNGMLFAGLPYREPDRLVRIESVHGGTRGKLSHLEIRELNASARLFVGFAGFRHTQYTVNAESDPAALPAVVNSWNLFDLLGVRPQLGTTWPPSDDGLASQYAVVLSHDGWQARFGGAPDIVGRVVTLDRVGYTVLGVMPAGFDFPGRVQIYRRVPAGDLDGRFIRNASVVARLKPGVTYAAAQAELDAIASRWAAEFPGTNAGLALTLRPLREYWIGAAGPVFLVLGVAAGAVALVAALNVAALLLVRVRGRRREWALRTALGAPAGALLRMLVLEGLTLSLLGALAALPLAWATTRLLAATLALQAPGWMHLGLDGRAIALAVSLAVALGLGVSVPAWRWGRRTDLRGVLQGGGRSLAGGNGPQRDGLVTVQLAAAFVLVTITLALLAHLRILEATPLGFAPERLLTLKVDPPGSQFNTVDATAPLYRRIEEAVGRLPGVEGVAANDAPPLAVPDPAEAAQVQLPLLEGQDLADAERNGFLTLQMVSERYFEVLRIPLRQGRGFDPTMRYGTPLVGIVSQTLARRLWGDRDPIGQRLRTIGQGGNYRPAGADALATAWITVIGVVDDVRHGGALGTAGADLYVSNQQQFVPESYLLVRTRGAPEAIGAAVRDAIRAVDPTQAVFDVRPMSDRMAAVIWRQRLAAQLLEGFGLLALGLAGIGLLSLQWHRFHAERRAIGVRLALGARPRQILLRVLLQAARPALGGLAIGAGLMLFLAEPLRHALPGMSRPAPAHYGLATLILAAAVLLTAAWPATRAARLDPAEILRDS